MRSMLAKSQSVALVGTDAHLVEVEIHIGTGVPSFTIVGLPAKSVREAEQRTRAALVSSDEEWKAARLVGWRAGWQWASLPSTVPSVRCAEFWRQPSPAAQRGCAA
jgi:hypothetical protein